MTENALSICLSTSETVLSRLAPYDLLLFLPVGRDFIDRRSPTTQSQRSTPNPPSGPSPALSLRGEGLTQNPPAGLAGEASKAALAHGLYQNFPHRHRLNLTRWCVRVRPFGRGPVRVAEHLLEASCS